MKLETCLQRNNRRTQGSKCSLSTPTAVNEMNLNSLFQREDLSSRDGVSVDKGEELLEDAEEGPV